MTNFFLPRYLYFAIAAVQAIEFVRFGREVAGEYLWFKYAEKLLQWSLKIEIEELSVTLQLSVAVHYLIQYKKVGFGTIYCVFFMIIHILLYNKFIFLNLFIFYLATSDLEESTSLVEPTGCSTFKNSNCTDRQEELGGSDLSQFRRTLRDDVTFEKSNNDLNFNR